MDLSQKVVVITGATGGIGREIVKKLDEKGCVCVLIGTHLDEVRNLAKTLKTSGGKFYAADFSDVEDVIKTGKDIATDFNGIDVLINLAGIGVYKPIEEVTLRDWEDSYAIGNTAPYFLAQTLISKLSKSEVSVVINAGSGMGVMAAAGRSVYSSMKFALRGQTLSLAEEFKRTKPHFVLLTMGSVLTSFGPMSLNAKKKDMESGKGYLTPQTVAIKVIEILQEGNPQAEYTLYPAGYANEWSK